MDCLGVKTEFPGDLPGNDPGRGLFVHPFRRQLAIGLQVTNVMDTKKLELSICKQVL